MGHRSLLALITLTFFVCGIDSFGLQNSCAISSQRFALASTTTSNSMETINVPTKEASERSPKKDAFTDKVNNGGVKVKPKKELTRKKPSDEEMEKLKFRSGIPTLRSSAHRVKFSPKNRKQDPKPKNRSGEETSTTWLPPEVRAEEMFAYNASTYDLSGALVRLLTACDSDLVGKFHDGSVRLEDFIVAPQSTWRSVNGGHCEDAQKYLSDRVVKDENLLGLFDKFVQEAVLPHLKRRLVEVGAASDEEGSTTFYYQRPPTLRLQPGPAWAQVKAHDDAQYGHQNGELNYWLPLTDRALTKVDLYCETEKGREDYHPVPAESGEIVSFHGSSCKHYVNPNGSDFTRVSMDFRVGVEGFFDPYWQMRGTTDDHGRQEARL